ncbi:MAG: SDR family NAD(P)-dependent oxidoreductase, partial [bacterium]
VKGLLYMTRALLPHMVRRDSGHVINIGSTAGHLVYPGGNVYNATKFAVRALTEGMNLDVVGTRVRVSSVDPGLVETEFSRVRFRGDEERAQKVYQGCTPLTPDDIADVVRYVAEAPPHVNVFQTIVLPTDQRNAYVLHRREPDSPDPDRGSESGSP